MAYWFNLVAGLRDRGALPYLANTSMYRLNKVWFFRILVLTQRVHDFTIKYLKQGGLCLGERSTYVMSKSAKPYDVSLKKIT